MIISDYYFDTLLGIIIAGKKCSGFGLSPPTQLFGFLGGMGHDTLYVAFNISIDIFNYLFEQNMPNYTKCATKLKRL